ncbi:MAG: sulfatase-like hydrolase/transferase [Planctomycetota bacterium]|nr:sulfatase-like hydrolase/transferase [Planctomycetota bacterium]
MARAAAQAAALCIALFVTPSCGSSAKPAAQGQDLAKLVLLVEVDTLRADALELPRAEPGGRRDPRSFGPASTPATAALAAEALVLTGAYSSAPWTLPSVATLMTGKWPWEHGATRLLGTLGSGHTTLAEAFALAGYRTGGVMTNFVATADYGFAQGFESWDDSLATGHTGSTGPAAVEKLLAMVDELGSTGEPVFLYTLLFEPHWRYEHDPAAGTPPPIAAVESLNELRASLAAGELSEDDLADLQDLYRGEVQRTDAALAALRAGLEQRGLWDDAIVVLTSDHGELIGERGWIGHTVDLSDTLVRVPLLVKAPGLRTGHESARVGQVDLGATLLDLAGVPAEARAGAFGKTPSFAPTLRDAAVAPTREQLYLHVDFEPALLSAASDRKRSLQWGVVEAATGRKWTVDHLAEGGPAGLLVDPDGDPWESTDLSSAHDPAALQTLRGLVPEPLAGRRGHEPVEDSP